MMTHRIRQERRVWGDVVALSAVATSSVSPGALSPDVMYLWRILLRIGIPSWLM